MAEHFPYENYNTWSQNNEKKERWTAVLESVGPASVRAVVVGNTASDGGELYIGGDRVTKGFAREWLKWHEDKAEAAEAARQAREDERQASLVRAAKGSTWAAIAAAVAAILTFGVTCIQAYVAWETMSAIQ